MPTPTETPAAERAATERQKRAHGEFASPPTIPVPPHRPAEAGRPHPAQPKHFWNLAFTEMWERFSYYGLQAVLTYYLIYTVAEGGLGLDATVAVSLVGAYGGSLYLAQLLGAWMADRVMPARRLVFWGAVIITSGHLSLVAVPGLAGLALGLGCIAIGTGLLKTNITSIIGILFGGWSREARDSGFSYFYLSINLGAVFGPLAVGWLQSSVGFHWAFGAAAVGMTAALVQYSLRMRDLPADADVVPNPVSGRGLLAAAGWAALGAAAVAVLVVLGAIRLDNLGAVVGIMIGAAAIASFAVMLSSRRIDAAARTRVRGYAPLWLAETLYYGFYLQLFTTVPLIVTARVDLQIGGWSFPEGWFAVVGTIALVLLIPLLATTWKERWIGRLLPSQKFVLGFVTIGVAYLLLIATAFSAGKTVSPWLIIVALVLAGISEAFVGPIGFSVVTRIAPVRFKTQFVALKILTLGAGSTLAALFATLYTAIPELLFFVLIGGGAVGAAAVLLLAARSIHRALDTGIDERGAPVAS